MTTDIIVQILNSIFGLNISTRTALSDVQKVGPNAFARGVHTNVCATPPSAYGYLLQGPYLFARHLDKRAGMPRSRRSYKFRRSPPERTLYEVKI